jgi:hypothetical protein
MRNPILVPAIALAAVLAFSPVAFSQDPHDPNWRRCPQCLTEKERGAAREKAANLPFDPRDLSGVWSDNQNRLQLDFNAPPLTPLGQAKYDATKTEETPEGKPISNSKDGMLICDPLGWPRWFTYNYGFEFVQLPGRTVQFLEWDHTWRTIWTDGRPLPKNPDPRWMGYSVGRWDGNTFVIESNGFDERSWLSENRKDRRWGWPHSEELRTVERYRRVNHNTLDVSLTITDPKIYTAPWVTTGNFLLNPGTELWEDFCVTSDSDYFNTKVLRPAAGDIKR